MSKIIVPVQGTNVTSSSVEVPQPAPHGENTGFEHGMFKPTPGNGNERTRHFRENGLGRTIQRSMERRAAASEPAPTQAPSPQPSADYSAMQAEIAALKQEVAGFKQSQQPQYAPPQATLQDLQAMHADSGQYWQDSQDYGDAPNPENYDLWDEGGRRQYRADHEASVRKAVEADRQARQSEAEANAINAEFAALQGRYGRDANFLDVAQLALRAVAEGRTDSITGAYERISDDIEARSEQRRSTRLPQGMRRLGQIWEYNQQTGRAVRRR